MRRIVSGLLTFAIYWSMFVPFVESAQGQAVANARINKMKDVPAGLTFRLSEGATGAEVRVKQSLSAADPLPGDAVSGILRSLPGIKSDPDDQAEFAKRVGTLPAPKAGTQIPVKFPSDEQRGTPKVDPGTSLGVVRFSPEGEVTLAPDLSVTFSQPMVAVTSQDEAAKYAPVELSPQVEGRWRWLGTRTLMFDTDKRFPMATKFTARVPAGTKAVNGQILSNDVTWTFTTPPPKVEQMYPQARVMRRDALMFISFDQAINPEAVLATISVTSGGRKISTRLATPEEVERDGTIKAYIKESQPGRWMVFRAVSADGSVANALPPASTINVSVNAGTPSAEGPLRTTKAQSYTFTTYGPFKYSKAFCGWEQNKNCTPFHDWYLEFNNPIDASVFAKELVTVTPAVEGLTVYPQGNHIYIRGIKKGRTSYTIAVDGSLKDTFGQQLGQKVSAVINVGSADQNLYTQGGAMSVLDPFGNRSYSIYSTNFRSVRVKLYAVEPTEWSQYQQYYRRLNYDDGRRPQMPGRLVSDKVVSIENKPDELVETRIDVSAGLSDGFGSVILDIEPAEDRSKAVTVRGNQTRILTWLQSTQIGLDAFVDNTELVGFATELQTGKPIEGVQLSLYPNSAVSTQTSKADQSWFDWAWELVAGSGGPNAGDIESIGSNGEEIESEPVTQSQTNNTGPNGMLRMLLPGSQGAPSILIAHRGKDVAFLPENSDNYWQDTGSWYKKPDHDSLRWFVFDDRKMYRPKEEVSVKGYIRHVTGGKLGDVQALADAASGLTWSVKDPRDNEIASGKGNLNAFGAFDLKFTLPDNVNLGYARIDLSTDSRLIGDTFQHQFQIQEFRRPEFEVTTKVESEAPHFVGGKADLSVEAKYYAGGGLANAETNWTVTATPTNYTPPNRDDFIFGTWFPWWRIYDHGGFEISGGRGVYGGGTTLYFKGVTDSAGRHLLKIDFESVNPPRPYNINASAAVQDVNRQTWSGAATLLVHPADLYVGVRTPRTFVQKGEKIVVESIVSDIDGKLIAGRTVDIKAVLKDWQFDKGSWSEVTVDEQTCSVTSADSPQKCEFVAKQGGRYTITATVMDDRERFNESEFTVWVPGGKHPPKRNVEQEEVQIIPSKKDYAPGEVAEILVISPFSPAEGVLTLRRDGIVKAERFSMKDSSATLKIPLDEKYLPNIYAQIDLVGAAARQDDKGEVDPKLAKRPAFASGSINLPISIASRKLTVSAEPLDKTLAPGGTTKVSVEVKDSGGEPVANSEVAVVVVDESVLALSAYSVPDPLSIFYVARGTGVTDHHLRSDILLGRPEDAKNPPPPPAALETVEVTASYGSNIVTQNLPVSGRRAAGLLAKEKDASADSPDNQITVRQNFNALAVFAPSTKTDSNGRVSVDVKLPDNLTRYRITAVSVDTGKRFGKGESTITAKQPLMVRPSAPRFMNFGDKIDLPVVIQNQTDQDMAVDVVVRGSNVVLGERANADAASETLTVQSGKRVLVKANSREEVRFPASTVKAGTARFQIAATSGKFSDAAEIELPVWTPATTEAFATYGTTDKDGALIQPVQTPGDVYPQFGGLEVTTSSTQLQELTDAFIYLTNYPYECTEQIASRMISIAAMRDVLSAFKSKDMPSADALQGQFARDIEILQSRQRDDGSFGLWKRDRERYEYPFLTVHVAHALVLAKSKGYKVPDEMLNKAKPFLSDVEGYFKDEWHKNSPQVRWTISAYALYVRDLMGNRDVGKAKKLLAEATIEKMPFEALGWTLSVLASDPGTTAEVDGIVRFLMNRTTETAAAANFVTDYGDGKWLIMYSNRRADGVLLEALIKMNNSGRGAAGASETLTVQSGDLIPKLVRGLLAHRTKGHWGTTQENVFILLALDKYFNTFEKVTPDFVTRVWLGSTYAGEEKFKGRSVDSNVLNIPMSYLAEQGGTSNLLIDRQGAGRLYYRIGMKYAPKNLKLDPADYGFTILRKYEAVDNADDVKQNADGGWTIKSGARVRVRLTMVAQARRYHVALVDNLPAGLEILNPGLAVTEAIPADTGGNTGIVTYGSPSFGHGWYYWRQHWFEHQNFRDERAEAFSSLLWEGVYNYTYVARATTPGEFVVPPAKAEEMYHPETFGRTGTDFVRVE